MIEPVDEEQVLDLCTRATNLVNNVSTYLVEYLDAWKQTSGGFRILAVNFLELCQTLWPLQSGLMSVHERQKGLPKEVLCELQGKMQHVIADLKTADLLLVKLLMYERKSGFTKFVKGLSMGSVDTEVRSLSEAFAKHRDSLRMASLAFEWASGKNQLDQSTTTAYKALAKVLKLATNTQSKPNKVLNLRVEDSVPTTPGSDARDTLNASLPDNKSSHTSYHSPARVASGVDRHLQLELPPLPNKRSNSRLQQQPANKFPEHTEIYQRSVNANTTRRLSSIDGVPSPANLSMKRWKEESAAGNSSHGSLESVLQLEDMLCGSSRGGGSNPSYLSKHQVPVFGSVRSSHIDGAFDKTVRAVSATNSAEHNPTHIVSSASIGPSNRAIASPLMQAILRNDVQKLHEILANNADPNRIDFDGISPLLVAAETASEEMTELLLRYHGDPNLCSGPQNIPPLAKAISSGLQTIAGLHLRYGGDCNMILPNGDTPFILAIQKSSSLDLIKLLLEEGADINKKTKEGKSPLFEAVSIRRIDVVALLLERGANPNLAGPKHPLWPSTYHAPILQLLIAYGANCDLAPGIMELAASINNIESVKSLIESGVSPNVKKDGVYTPLCTAIRDDRSDIIALLLKSGANPNLPASEYPCFKCITHNRLQYLPQLVAAGADLHQPPGILETAVARQSSEAVVYLLRNGVDVNARTSEGRTALTTAIRSSQLAMVDKMLSNGANPAIRGENWPLCMAVKAPQILERLIRDIADPGSATRGIMELAVQANRLESVKLLVAAGVNVEDKTGGVFSPLTTAIREDRKDIVRYLLDEAGADINAPGEHLPLIKAIRRNTDSKDTEIIEMLLARGADINLIYRGWNAVMQAVEKGDSKILRLLLEKGNGIDLQVVDPESNKAVIDLIKNRGWDEGVNMLLEHRKQARMITP